MLHNCEACLQVHVKNRCAWLNHSSNPAAFIRLVERFPNIRLWFSGVRILSSVTLPRSPCPQVPEGCTGTCKSTRVVLRDSNSYVQHFHLSHNYADSISVVGRCAFVQVGVIGDCNRDGLRHSRLLRGVQGMPSVLRQPQSSPRWFVRPRPRLAPAVPWATCSMPVRP
jgi:hypothetical protein